MACEWIKMTNIIFNLDIFENMVSFEIIYHLKETQPQYLLNQRITVCKVEMIKECFQT